jgi:hypothetical protein
VLCNVVVVCFARRVVTGHRSRDSLTAFVNYFGVILDLRGRHFRVTHRANISDCASSLSERPLAVVVALAVAAYEMWRSVVGDAVRERGRSDVFHVDRP